MIKNDDVIRPYFMNIRNACLFIKLSEFQFEP
jgi:hypothetical protein